MIRWVHFYPKNYKPSNEAADEILFSSCAGIGRYCHALLS
jgi:hypothetical protein